MKLLSRLSSSKISYQIPSWLGSLKCQMSNTGCQDRASSLRKGAENAIESDLLSIFFLYNLFFMNPSFLMNSKNISTIFAVNALNMFDLNIF